MTTVKITLHGTEVIAHGEYYAGFGDNPYDGQSFDVEKITIGDQDITDIAFGSMKQGEIERKALDAYVQMGSY